MELAHLSRVGILGELAGSIAHELNQPLSAMLSNAQVGRNHLDAASPDMQEMREILEDIAADAKRAGGIIHGMRAMFKKDAPPNPQPIDPDECVIKVVSLLRSEIISRKVMVEHHPSAKKTSAMGGRVEMQQVLINLESAVEDRSTIEKTLISFGFHNQTGMMHLHSIGERP